mmetsp:Transcript_909/g.1437  ORF Transcript_909/g.1437 Transcript_909/m.1437 type:complete len:215 (-) Transcript_909:162-806(-)|eukprot:CAMPEP_0178773958 /NCGR_PEP_ID=MMETSP0744-20121128/23380_1 /TAXON_ID=913974 /ORGANISM="Nitzschia punctata, Strain CCMP561" /LENGTH=214 /DNA_ID=CAMNT_0020430791 /DNA_START=133 /DNA_END=777 /DNA_ORIENTATION=+
MTSSTQSATSTEFTSSSSPHKTNTDASSTTLSLSPLSLAIAATTNMIKNQAPISPTSEPYHPRQYLVHSRDHLRLPYAMDGDSSKISLHDWLARLDNIIEGCKAARQEHNPASTIAQTGRHHLNVPAAPQDVVTHTSKRSASSFEGNQGSGFEGEEESPACPPPRRKKQRRNSFVIHRDANGHNFSLLGSSFEDILKQANEEDEKESQAAARKD